MPELPEVQTVINYLKNNILNEIIEDIFVFKNKLIKNVDPSEFIDKVKKQEIVDIQRKGKYIIFYLTNNLVIVSHLRMEGKFFVDNKQKHNRKHDYIVFVLSNNKFLSFNDSRQFGTFHLCNKDELESLKEIAKLAKDPLDRTFDINDFCKKVKKSSKNIKTILLDQTIISGLGNIYANEVLFASKIHPITKGKELSQEKIELIFENSKIILQKALKYNGTTIHSFSFANDQSGNFSQFLKVHSRENQNCYICQNKIIREKINGRSSYFCPKCQK